MGIRHRQAYLEEIAVGPKGTIWRFGFYPLFDQMGVGRMYLSKEIVDTLDTDRSFELQAVHPCPGMRGLSNWAEYRRG
jgi:hypothetical protein